jgi:O-antigen/teichoic acid export membrane protein
LLEATPSLVDWFYNPAYGVGYVLISNLIATIAVTLLLIPEIKKATFHINVRLLKEILKYSLPLLVLGIAGIMNQTVDKIIFPYLMPDREIANSQLGIYGACFKIAMVMMVFTQAFRYAYEPFIFAQNKGGDKRREYADAMKFFIIFSLLIFLGMMFYLDILKYLIRSDYWEGLRIVPIILMSYLFQGVFFNLSLWYKLIDKTQYGAYLSIVGLIITLAINILFVPHFGYVASAAASFVCYLAIMLISYHFGQKHYPIAYDLKSIGLYFIVAVGLFALSYISPAEGWLGYLQNTILLMLYLLLIIKRDLPLSAIPVANKFFKKR